MKDVFSIIKNNDISGIQYEHALHSLKYNTYSKCHTESHNTISVYNPIHNEYVDIDTNIVPLIEYIWKNNISTTLSCENNSPNNYIWVCFATGTDLELFLKIVFRDVKIGDDFYDRGFPHWGTEDGWYYSINADRNSEYDGLSETDNVFISISVRFPQRDYDTVLNKLKLHFDNNQIQLNKSLSESDLNTSDESSDTNNKPSMVKILMDEIQKRDAQIARLRNEHEKYS